MVYCQKCGTNNDDDAEFCKKCGNSLMTTVKAPKKRNDQCDEECAFSERSPWSKFFWGIILILFGLWIVFSVVIPETSLENDLPSWLVHFEFWWLIGLIIAIAIIMTGIRVMIRK